MSFKFLTHDGRQVIRLLKNDKMIWMAQEGVQRIFFGNKMVWEKPDDNPFELDLLGYNVLLPTLWDVQDQINSRTQNYQEIDRIVIHLKKGNQFTLSDISKDGSNDIQAGNVSPSGSRFISNSDIDKVLVYLKK